MRRVVLCSEAALLRSAQGASLAWRQEEPREAASPAAGSHKVHLAEQEALVKPALG